MTEGKKLSLTIEEGQALLMIAAFFNLPAKLSEEQNYTPTDRSLAQGEVGMLYKEMRSWSPMMLMKERWHRFGPKELWTEFMLESGQVGHRCSDNTKTVSININDDIVSGIVWCLLVALHPSSQAAAGVGDQVNLYWPIAAKLGKTKAIKEMIGLTTEKIKRIRFKNDDEYTEEKTVSEKAKD